MSRYRRLTPNHPNPSTVQEGFRNIAQSLVVQVVQDMKTPANKKTTALWVLKNPAFEFWITAAQLINYEDSIKYMAEGVLKNEKN